MIQKISPSFIWITAFLCGLFFVKSWELELFASAVILVFIWSVFSIARRKEWSIPSSFVLKIMGLFWLLVFISVVGSDIISVSFMAFGLFSVLPLTFFIFTFSGNKTDYIFVAKVGGLIYAGLALWALIQVLFLPELFDGRAAHPLSNPNSLAALFSLGFFCAVGWMLSAPQKIHQYMAVSLSILLFAGMMAAGSRGALFALCPVLMMLLFFMRPTVIERKGYIMTLFVSCAVIFCLTKFGFNEAQNLFDRVADTPVQNLDRFTSNRTRLWAASFEMIKNYGFFGTGIGTYFLYFPEFRLSDDPFGAYFAHNDPIQYWVELGILGPVLFYAFVISVIVRTVKAVKKTSSNQNRLLILTPFCALGATILHTHVTFNLYNLSILFVVGFLLSVWFYATQTVLKTPLKPILLPSQAVVRLAAVSLPFVLIGGMFLAYIAGEHYNNKARDALISGDLNQFATDVVRAQTVGLNGNYRPYLLAVSVPLGVLEEGGSQLEASQKKEMTEVALRYLQHVRAINPRSSSALYYLGKLQEIGFPDALPHDLQTAEEYYLEAIKIDPLHIGARLAVAKIYEESGDNQKALRILEEGIRYKYLSPNALNLYGALARHYLLAGDTENRKRALERLRSFQKKLDTDFQKGGKTLGAQISQHLWAE